MIKKIVMILLIILVGFMVYSFIPRVSSVATEYGRGLEDSDILSDETLEEMSHFYENEARRMHATMIIHDGKVLFEKGDTDKLMNCHSARKSIMSVLVGIAVDKGIVDLDETLEDMGVDESKTPLSDTEKGATVRDILMCTSGIFLKAEAEHDWQESLRPTRGQYKPGEYFFYNNFDFNILGVILEKKSGLTIGEFMEEHLAIPLGMEDFSSKHVVYNSPWPVPNVSDSDHPVYWIFMTPRDFGKIGVLIANDGYYNGVEVVSKAWVDESLYPYSNLDDYGDLYEPYEAFSYSWWIEDQTETVWADGFGGQFLCINREKKLVAVQRNFTGNSLLTSGLFLLDKNKDNNPKSDLIHLYNIVDKALK